MLRYGPTYQHSCLSAGTILALRSPETVRPHPCRLLCLLISIRCHRVFAALYAHDKSLSSLLGRPPQLCRRYCSLQLPLDLDIHQLQLPQDQLQSVIDGLDADGWNREESVIGTAYNRAHLIGSMVREDILELSIASLPQIDVAFAE